MLREAQARVIWRSIPQDFREGLLRDSLAQYGVSFTQPGPPEGMAFHNSSHTNNAGVIPTNSPASPLTPFNQVPTPSYAPVILLNFDSKATFANEPLESWSGFIEHWEVDMLTYGLDYRQPAMCLPKSLKGTAYQKYIDLVNQIHPSIRSHLALKEELGKFFLRHKTMKGRSLFTLIQGKKSVRKFYEIVIAGNSAYTGVPESFKNEFIRDAFVNRLRERYHEKVLLAEDVTLEKALNIAKIEGKGQKVVAAQNQSVNSVTSQKDQKDHNEMDALKKKIKALKDLVQNQSGSKKGSSKNEPKKKFKKAPNNQRERADKEKEQTKSKPAAQGRGSKGRNGDRNKYCRWYKMNSHWLSEFYRKPKNGGSVNSAKVEDMPDDQFAAALLSQPTQESDHKANAISHKGRRKPNAVRGGRGGKLSSATYLHVATFALLCCILPVECIYPDAPLICGSRPKDQLHIYKVNSDYHCDVNQASNITLRPSKMSLMIYQKNLVKWASKAYQCSKYIITDSRQISLFRDVKTKTTASTQNSVTPEKCNTMVQTLRCTAGVLKAGYGVYITHNPTNAEYEYCCKEHDL